MKTITLILIFFSFVGCANMQKSADNNKAKRSVAQVYNNAEFNPYLESS